MISIALGKIAVTTPGTPVPVSLTAAQAAQLPPNGAVHKIEAWADPADAGSSYVKQGTVTIAALPKPANGHAEHWQAAGPKGSNVINPLAYSADADNAGGGPFVTLWVE